MEAPPIENLKTGDFVVAFDETKQDTVLSRVTNVVQKTWYELRRIIAGQDTILATENHPFFLPCLNRYLPADSLRQGMQLLSLVGTLLTVQQVTAIDTTVQVYNFEVEEQHNYFVGEVGVLVHNANGTCELDEAGLKGEDFNIFERIYGEGNTGTIEGIFRTYLKQAPNKQELIDFYRYGEISAAGADAVHIKEVRENRLRAWEALFAPHISEDMRSNIANLTFLSNYLKRFPEEASSIKGSLTNAVNEQNWLDLFELEDVATRTGLVKQGAYFTQIEHIPWSSTFTQDFVNQLQVLRAEFGDDFGRFDLIEFDFDISDEIVASVTLDPISPGVNQMTLEINLSWLNQYENSTYAQLLADLEADGIAGKFVARSMEDVVNHEFGHLITMDAGSTLGVQADYEASLFDPDFLTAIDDISDYCTIGSGDDGFEALAEIFAAHKQGRVIPDVLKDFYNFYSPHYEIP